MKNILHSFDKKKSAYDSYSLHLKSTLNSLLLNEGISVHSLESRVKDRDSLEKKLIKKEKYKNIDEVTDVVGVRIITHYSGDVDRVAEVVEREFLVDRENSIDKRSSLEPDRFGYLSLHYIVSLNDDRANLRENSEFKNTKSEIQIRTILQHAWAEIEHDIGYKSNVGLPDEMRRKFSRLAGLLEIADSEFENIKTHIKSHEKKVAIEIASGETNIPIDRISLAEYVNKTPHIDEILNEIYNKKGIEFIPTASSDKEMDSAINGLKFLNIKTIDALDRLLNEHQHLILNRIEAFGKDNAIIYPKVLLPRECIISYLLHIIIAKANDKELELAFANATFIPPMSNEYTIEFFSKLREKLPK